VESHALDLRSEVKDENLVEAVKNDWRRADLPPRERTLLEYAEKLTRTPDAVGKADVDRLRASGFSDAGIHDLVQVIAYFNYINRVADGLGTDPEEFLEVGGARDNGDG